METIESVHEFWFGVLTDPEKIDKEQTGRWFRKDAAFDAEIRDRFGETIEAALRGQLDDWGATAKGSLALLVLLDQLPRNAFRGTPRSFSCDDKARQVARKALASGHDKEVYPIASVFFYLPLEHSEDRADQAEAVERLGARVEIAGGRVKEVLASYLEYAGKHRAIIERFGRFPHRNEILGRESTPEEIAFLKEPGSSF